MKKEMEASMPEIEPEEIKISYRRPLYLSIKKITQTDDPQTIMREYLKQQSISLDYIEYLWMICLSRCNGVLGINMISQGGNNGTSLTIPQLLQIALMQNASGVIIVHNHPSGNVNPSEQDITLNKRMRKALEAIQIQQLDHVILTSESYTSFAKEGIL